MNPKKMSTAIRNGIGGPQIGMLHPSASLTVKEEREGWVLVTVDGWMNKEELRSKGEATQQSTAGVTVGDKSPLVVEDFTLEEQSKVETRDKARIKLTLRLRNNSQETLNKWQGIMAIQHVGGAIMTRLGITGPAEEVRAGDVQFATFSWTEDEKEYQMLKGREKSELKISIAGIRPQ